MENQHTSDSFTIRQCTSNDEEAAIGVCLQTGDAGNDATSHFSDPKVLGYRYVSPYIHLSPELAFVLQDSDGIVCGYVLAALHSDLFYKRYVDEWLPKMRQLYPTIPSGKKSADYYKRGLLHCDERVKRDWEVIEVFHKDNLQSLKLFDEYPSHLHIDLLPRAQRKRYGTKMIHHIENELRRRGSNGVYLEMAPSNTRAFHFYTKLGFVILAQDQGTLWLGKKLTT